MSRKSTAAMLAMMAALGAMGGVDMPREVGPQYYGRNTLGPKVRKTKKKANVTKARAKTKAAKRARKRNRS